MSFHPSLQVMLEAVELRRRREQECKVEDQSIPGSDMDIEW